jgi:protein-tyrosine phosphatase
MPNERREILFVCTGNICRSPVAEFLAEEFAREAGRPLTASSAGVEAEIGKGMTPGAARTLASRGLRSSKHIARQLSEEMLAAADEVYALTQDHKAIIVGRFPAHAAKVKVLREAAGLPDVDVDDPYGESDGIYESCALSIAEALDVLIRRNSHAENSR